MILTKAQRAALKRVFDRRPIYPNGESSVQIVQRHGWTFHTDENLRDQNGYPVSYWKHHKYSARYMESETIVADYRYATPLTYRQFRKLHVGSGWDCIMVHWLGMWLGIEKDGYVHS